MKTFLFAFFLAFASIAHSQKIDSVDIPKGVVYKYGDPAIVLKAKTLVQKELSDSVSYEMNNGIVFIGPVLWSRYKEIPELKNIPGGKSDASFQR